MSRVICVSTAALLVSMAATAAPLSAQYRYGGMPAPAAGTPGTPGAPAAPMVGEMAPDFSAPIADATGAKSARVSLAGLRGHVVVVAFYPKDRTSGCTAELSKFRDEFSAMFGEDVAVLPISLDDLDSHVSWAQEMHLPFALVSDTTGKIATAYGSLPPGKSYASRTVFVVGKDGKVSYRELRFNPVDQHAYDALKEAIEKAKRA
jgi:peroxiredoxin